MSSPATTSTEHAPLFRWNSIPDELNVPNCPADEIRRIHIYDFDNCLYKSPQPNRHLYTQSTLGIIWGQEHTIQGGWWAEPSFLEESLAESLATTSPSSDTYWCEEIRKLAQLSFEATDTVSVLLTGRKELRFSELLGRMLTVTRNLSNRGVNDLKFSAVCLKKNNSQVATVKGILPEDNGISTQESSSNNDYMHTADYKKALFTDFITYYKNLEEITIYDDRIKQINSFKTFFNNFQPRCKFQWFVIPVTPKSTTLDPAMEYKLVTKMIEEHNRELLKLSRQPGQYKSNYEELTIKWTPRQCGFFLDKKSQRKLLSFSYAYLRKGPMKKIGNLSEYPMYIPVCRPGLTPSKRDTFKLLTGITDDSAESSARITQVVNDFYAGKYHPGEEDEVEFKVVGIFYRARKSGDDTQPMVCDMHYRCEPVDKTRFVGNTLRELIIVGHLTGEDSKADNDIIASIAAAANKKAVAWRKLQRPFKIRTTFGFYMKMKII